MITKTKQQERADHEADKILTKKVFPSYLFKEGEKWTHIDKFGNVCYEDIKTTSEQMQEELEPILKKWKKATLNEKPLLSLSVMN